MRSFGSFASPSSRKDRVGFSVGAAVRLVGGLLFGACALFIIAAFSIEGTDVPGIGVPGAQPGSPGVVRRARSALSRPWLAIPGRSPAPEVKPAGRPSFVEWLGDEYNLRKCSCLREHKSAPAGAPVCRCERECAPAVTPAYLTEAKGQGVCSLEEPQGFNCYAVCVDPAALGPADEPAKWFAIPCGGDGQPACDRPILAHRAEARKAARAAEEAAKSAAAEERHKALFPVRDWDPEEVYDLRGLTCELLDGEERCFTEDEQGRDVCPRGVTHETLGFPDGQFLCSTASVDKYYCTVTCTEGAPTISWGAHEIAWCYDPKNLGSCPPRPKPIPKAQFSLKPWSLPPEVETPCQARWRAGERPPRIEALTIGLLTHEARAFADSMKTYEELGLFDVVGEFLIYMNKRRPEVEAVAEEYRAKHPTLIKLLGDAANHGILRPMQWLVSNSSNEHFMFLERDFQLVEPGTCVHEQFSTAMRLLDDKTAHVVRFRHRKKAGRPNHAARMFMGHEDDVFRNGQPNLFCNHFYWVPQPEKRWPDKIWFCHNAARGDAYMYCSDSFYCNWTNNPQMWLKSWWNREYETGPLAFPNFKRNDPWYDVEVYMNWEPMSWNDRKFTVAQGQGLFKHSDRNKWG